MFQHFGMENVFRQFVVRHFFRVLLLSHKGGPMNSPVNFVSILKQYGTDEKCRTALEKLRWPKNITCPKCDSDKISRVYERGTFDCDNCRYQFSVTSGTMLHDTHLPLTVWFYVTFVMCESKKGVSANQIKRMFGISYKTAWYLCHRIRAAMLEIAPEKLDGTVEVDETYVGGKARRWRSRSDKQVVIGIRQRNGDLPLPHQSLPVSPPMRCESLPADETIPPLDLAARKLARAAALRYVLRSPTREVMECPIDLLTLLAGAAVGDGHGRRGPAEG